MTSYDYLLLFWEYLRHVFHIVLPYRELHCHVCPTLASDAYKNIGLNLFTNIKYPSPPDISESKLLKRISRLCKENSCFKSKKSIVEDIIALFLLIYVL